MPRAPFIVIEGLDRSGKTTQTAILHARLEELGVRAKLLKFPERTTPIGQMIDSYLRSHSDLDDRAIHLLFSANRWELASTITDLLTSGTLVLCDRYAFSGIAFSASKEGLPYEWCRAPDVCLPAPDLTVFLDITPEKARERGGYGEERYEKEEMQRRVREVFGRIEAEMSSGRGSGEVERDEGDLGGTRSKWVTVDAGREREVVTEDVWRLIEPLIRGVKGPIERLWPDKLS